MSYANGTYLFLARSSALFSTIKTTTGGKKKEKPSGHENVNHIPWITYWKGFRYFSRAELEFNFGYLNNILEPPLLAIPFRLGTAIDTEKDHLHGRRSPFLLLLPGFLILFLYCRRRWCVRDSAFRVLAVFKGNHWRKKLMPPLPGKKGKKRDKNAPYFEAIRSL